jgi:hypothetical protein
MSMSYKAITTFILACHTMNYDITKALNMHFNQRIKRKWRRTFTSLLDQLKYLYQANPHFGQVGSSTYTLKQHTHFDMHGLIYN